jgi:hypothetical protein
MNGIECKINGMMKNTSVNKIFKLEFFIDRLCLSLNFSPPKLVRATAARLEFRCGIKEIYVINK